MAAINCAHRRTARRLTTSGDNRQLERQHRVVVRGWTNYEDVCHSTSPRQLLARPARNRCECQRVPHEAGPDPSGQRTAHRTPYANQWLQRSRQTHKAHDRRRCAKFASPGARATKRCFVLASRPNVVRVCIVSGSTWSIGSMVQGALEFPAAPHAAFLKPGRKSPED